MRSHLWIPILLTVSVAGSSSLAARECAMVHKGSGWQRGKLAKVQVEERAEGPAGEPADGTAARGQLLRLIVKAGAATYAARCAVGTDGCDPAALTGADEISFVILGKTPESRRLVFPRPDGHLLCAQVAR